MENNKISNVLESILFVAGEPIRAVDIQSKLNISIKEYNRAVSDLELKYGGDSGIILKKFGDKLQLSTNPNYTSDLSLVLNPIRERALGKATIETLSIIAYKQPITRLEIEEIRGVSCDYSVNTLIDHNLIQIVGKKDAVGKPVLFGTTDEFLKRFNLNSLDDLPDKASLLDRIKTIRDEERDQSLYRNFDISSEEIVPDSIRLKQEQDKQEIAQILDSEREKLGIQGDSITEKFVSKKDFV